MTSGTFVGQRFGTQPLRNHIALKGRTHEQEDDIGGHSWELDCTAVDGLH